MNSNLKIDNIKISSSKGKIDISIYYPEKETEKLAVLCPGYLDSKDYKGLVGLAHVLCGRGYAVVAFDPTGTWESAGDIADYTNTQYLEDVKNVIGYMKRQKDYKYILLGGHSRGGQIALLYAATDQGVSMVLGIMASSGKTEDEVMKEWKKNKVRVSQRDVPNGGGKSIEYRVPISHAEDRDKYDVLRDVKKIKVPVILVTGELDDKVLPEEVKAIYENANEPKRFVVIPGIDHDYRHNQDKIDIVNQEILKQIDSLK